MNNPLSPFTRAAAALLALALVGTFAATAADPAPAPPTGAPPDQTGRGGFNRGGPQNRGNQQGRGGASGPGGIGLDDKQRELYREATQKSGDELRKLDEKLTAAQKELMQSVLAENYDEKVVREKAEAVAKIQTDITVLRAKALSTVAPTLQPEQREQLETSRFGAAMLTGGGMTGGLGGGGTPPDRTQGFRNRDGQTGADGPPSRDDGQTRRRNRPQ